MEYKEFIKKLEKRNIKLFDYEKRKLYYQLSNNIMIGGNCINCFLKCDNQKYIINQYQKNKCNIKFINKTYKEIN